MVAVATADAGDGGAAADVAGAGESETQGAGRRIARAAAILLGGFVVSRLVGLLRDVVIFGQFGTSGDLDLYFAAFRIPDLIFNLVAGGALGSAIVPVFAEYRAGRSAREATRLASTVFNAVGVVAVLGAILGILCTPVLVPFLGAGFSPEQQARLAVLVRILLLQPIFFGLGEVVTRYLNVRGHFTLPAIAPTLYNLCIIGAALVLGPRFGTVGLATGVVAGALLYLVVQLPVARAGGFRWDLSLDLRDAGLRRIVPLMVPRLLDRGAVQVSFLLTTRLASYLPDGRFAALNLAWTLMMLPLGTLAMSAANAAFPVLSEQAARGEYRALAATVRRTMGSILFLMVPAAVGLALVGLPLVQLVFVRGQFNQQSAVWTAVALAVYAVGLPAHGAIEVLARSFYALHNTRTPVVLSVLAMACNVLLATLLVGPVGFAGIAAAMTVSATLEAIVLFLFLWARVPDLGNLDLLRSTSRTLLAGGAMLAATGGALVASRGLLHLAPLVELIGTAVIGTLTYALAGFVFRSPELHDVLSIVRRRWQRWRRRGSPPARPSTL
jgi:putative peptidoglycan lipid II flippase